MVTLGNLTDAVVLTWKFETSGYIPRNQRVATQCICYGMVW